jgi:hypothetical protein
VSCARVIRISSQVCLLIGVILGVIQKAESAEDRDIRQLSTPLHLKVEISSESDSIRVGADLPLQITVTNVSPNPIRIPAALERWGGIEAVSPSGEQATFLREWPVQFEGSRDQTIVLLPGAWYGQTDSKTTRLNEPGRWTIWWTLHVPFGTKDISFEPGHAKSNESAVTAITMSDEATGAERLASESDLLNTSPLRVDVVAVSDTINVGDSPDFQVCVKNVSPQPFRIPTNLSDWGLVSALRPNGAEVRYSQKVLGDFVGTREETALLPSACWYGQRLSALILLTEPGDWLVSWTLCVPEGNSNVPMKSGTARSSATVVTAIQ